MRFLCHQPHKCCLAPLENGIFHIRKELQDRLWPLNGRYGWDTYPDARKYSTFGNRSWSTAMAFGHAIEFANSIGIERIEARHRALMTYFKRHLLSFPGVEPTPNDPAMYCAQSAFRIPKVPAGELADFLTEKDKIVVGGARVDIGYYITWGELNRTLEVFDHVTRKGIKS